MRVLNFASYTAQVVKMFPMTDTYITLVAGTSSVFNYCVSPAKYFRLEFVF